MLIISGKVFNLEGRTVPVNDDKRFVLNFTVSEYLGKRDEEAQYRSYSVSVWDKRGESLAKFLKEKSIVTVSSKHFKAEGFKSEKGKDGIDAKIKIEIWSNDNIDVLYTPGGADKGGADTPASDPNEEDDDDPFKS